MLVGENVELGQGFDVIAQVVSTAAQTGFNIYKGLTEMKQQRAAIKAASASEVAMARAAADQAAAMAAAARAQQGGLSNLSPWIWGAIAVGGVALLGGGAYLLFRKPRPAPAPAA